jgi:DNA-binding CsgD family transcriptional regulator
MKAENERRSDDRITERLVPVPVNRLAVHELPGGAVVLAFDLEPAPEPSDELLAKLPPGQARVVALALEGLRDEEIAARLGLSRHTVSNHLRRAYARFGVNSRSELSAHLREARARTRG